MKLDPRHLANLLAVAEQGSFNRAASVRGLSQPALSNSIAQLERQLGLAVLNRHHNGSELNEFGDILVAGARTIEALLRHTAEQLTLKRLGIAGPLSVGVTPSMSLKFMPDLMAQMLPGTGPAQISIFEALDDELLPALRAGKLDLILGPVGGREPPDDLVEEYLFDDAYRLGVAPKNVLAKRRSVSLTELLDMPWVLPAPGSSYHRHVEALFLTAGADFPQDVVVCDSLNLLESIVARTDRITIITQLEASMHNHWKVRAVPLKGGGHRKIGIKWRRSGHMHVLALRLLEAARSSAKTYRGNAL